MPLCCLNLEVLFNLQKEVCFVFINLWWSKRNSSFTVIYLWEERKWNWKCLSLGDLCKVLCDDVVEKDEEAISALWICELNQVSVMTTVKHSDFSVFFSNKNSTIISFAVPSNRSKFIHFHLMPPEWARRVTHSLRRAMKRAVSMQLWSGRQCEGPAGEGT